MDSTPYEIDRGQGTRKMYWLNPTEVPQAMYEVLDRRLPDSQRNRWMIVVDQESRFAKDTHFLFGQLQGMFGRGLGCRMPI